MHEPMRLNRFIALSGVCSRREADDLIVAGKISVNGKVTTELGQKVHPEEDKIHYSGSRLMIKNFVYLLMNKPKNHITTVKDEQGRRTVLDLARNYTQERVYPVGRLDRNTTGLLLLTNDGELAKKMTHPSHKVKKLYHVKCDREVTENDLAMLKEGLELEDGFVKPDGVSYIENRPFNEISIQLHSGKNRIVRRMMEHLGLLVHGLDRVQIGSLTKKNLPRGTCRFLTEKEVGFIRMIK